ncbi:hypothetical protein Kpol_387p1, partial [Vanderwaltozyma polyspora DSM 70294]
KLFPKFFALQTLTPFLLAATTPLALTCIPKAVLGVIATTGLLNLGCLLPILNKDREQRIEVEKNENDQSFQQKETAIVKKFDKVHLISMAVNLANIASLGYYGYLLIKHYTV